MRLDTLRLREHDYDEVHAFGFGHEPPAWNPYRDLRQRLAWRAGDAEAEFEKSQGDIAIWRGLGR